MNIQEFLKETLVQISKGIEEAQYEDALWVTGKQTGEKLWVDLN